MTTPTPKPAEPSAEDKAYLRKQLLKFFLFLGVSVGVSLWLMIKEIWPASALINLQAKWFDGSFYPKITFGLIWIFVLLVCTGLFLFFGWIINLLKGNKNGSK